MPFSNDILIRAIIFALGACGFLVAKHIRNHKIKSTPLVCPVGFDCNAVVHSDYSKFLGVPVEFLGMIYYALISFVYLFVIFAGTTSFYLNGFLVLTSLLALVFSIYLIYVQIFILKKGCSWCFVSASISILIFSLTMSIYDFSSLVQIFVR
jgi:uncharacterized membrane protein